MSIPVQPKLTERAFRSLTRYVYDQCGVVLSEHKKSLVFSRLSRRVRALGLTSFDAYVDVLQERDAEGSERQHLVNCITTNKTEFFRERHHFELLARRLPQIEAAKARQGTRQLRVWSSACSTGEEPYSIAMLLADYFAKRPGWDVRVLATDIDTTALERTSQATYPEVSLEPVPPRYRRAWFTTVEGGVRVAASVRRMVVTRQVNLVSDPLVFRSPIDVVFCRNVLIYFDASTKSRVIDRLAGTLSPGGLLFIGHSESMAMEGKPFRSLGNTAYEKS